MWIDLSRNDLTIISSVIMCAILLSLPITQIYASSENVVWKTFKEKNGLFTIKYPSNWSPLKAYPDSTAPINIVFSYTGRESSFAELYLIGQESIYTNATDLVDDYPVYLQNEQSFKLLQPTECGTYTISNLTACDTIITFKSSHLDGKPVIKDLIVGTIGEDGSEYIAEYYVTKDLFDTFLPVVEEMIRSINITDTSGLPESDSATDDFPGLPPLSEPTIGKL